ncbi:MAG: GAF domain-containing protein, partial [candidate division Zixibacteria bacterium]|nr:GAF domain-containing protein [candidate division Zixibacteria bacterium]
VVYKKELSIGAEFDPSKYIKTNSSDRFSAWAAGIMKPIVLSNEGPDNHLSGSGIGSLVVVPLRIENRPVGLICLTHTEIGFFGEHDVELFLMIAHQIGVSRERAIYQKELEDRNEELEKAQKMLELTQKRLINDERLLAVRELSVSINHEINNPLSVIVGNIQCLLFIEKNLDNKVIERLNRVEAEAMKIADINHRLLEIDKLVSETYINDGQKIKMINIEKSSSGANNV